MMSNFRQVKELYNSRIHPKLPNGCKHPNFIVHNYNLVCTECGTVLDDEEKKFRQDLKRTYNYTDVIKKSHNNIIEYKFDSNRTTFNIGDIRKDFKKWSNLRKKNHWESERKYTRMKEAKVSISNCIKFIGIDSNSVLSSHVDYILYKTGDYNLQGKSFNIYSSCILVYCLRLCGLSEKLKHIYGYYKIKKKMSLFNMMRDLISKYNLKPVERAGLFPNVTRYLNELIGMYNIETDIMELIKCSEICVDIIDSMSNGTSISCKAAGIIYYLFKRYGIRITQDQVAKCTHTSTVSLRTTFNILMEYDI